MSSNISKMVKDEKKDKAQAVAISYSVLKKACGVEGEKKMTPKEIVAAGEKGEGTVEVSFGESKAAFQVNDVQGIVGATVDEPGKDVLAVVDAVKKAVSGFQPFEDSDLVIVDVFGRGKEVEIRLELGDEWAKDLEGSDGVDDVLRQWHKDLSDEGGLSVTPAVRRKAFREYVKNDFLPDLQRKVRGKFKVDSGSAGAVEKGFVSLYAKPEAFGLATESVVQVMFGTELGEAGESTPMLCNECGAKFKKKLTAKTFEVKCPKCGSYDTEPAGV